MNQLLRFNAAILICFSLGGSENHLQYAAVESNGQTSEVSERERAVTAAVERLLETLRKGDVEGFLSFCSREGVDIGVDNILTCEEIKQAMKERDPLYCHYFDTACLHEYFRQTNYKPPEDLRGPLPLRLSYRELLDRVCDLDFSIDLRFENWANVTVKWKSPKPRDVGLVRFLEFSFALEDGEWKLTADSWY